MSTREVEARMKITGRDMTGSMWAKLAGNMRQVNAQAAALNRQQRILGKTTASTMAMMTRYLAPAAVTAFTVGAVKDFAAVERQMGRIGITAGASAKETDAAMGVVRQVTKDLSMTLEPGVEAMDTITASGKDMAEALRFLPSVLATTQASGAAASDIANTALKTASALNIEADQMQRAFDIMVTGGKAGQFELKDMASYIPELANSFATLGYSGEEGLKHLIAMLQTLREDTGSATAAATQAQNIFGKMYNADTAKKFASFGIDLRRELAAAKKNGEDAVSAFVRLSKEAIKGDLTKLPLLFTDQEFRLGMQSLITSSDSLERFFKVLNSSEVDGAVLRDVKRITGDTQASIDRLAASWDTLVAKFGASASKLAVPVMDAISDATDKQDAIDRALKDRGMGYLESQWYQVGLSQRDQDLLALEGEYKDPELRKKYEQGPVLPKDWNTSEEFPADKHAGPERKVKGSDGRWYAPTPLSGPVPDQKLIDGLIGSDRARDQVTAAMLARRGEIEYFNRRGDDFSHPSAPDDYAGEAASYRPYRTQRAYGDSVVDKHYPRLEKSMVEAMRGGDRRSYEERSAGMEPWTPTRVLDGIKDFFSPQQAEPVGEALAQAAISKLSSDAGAVGTELGSVVREAIMAASPQIGAAIAQAFAAGASQVKVGLNTAGIGAPAGGRPVNADTGRTMPASIGKPASTGG